ncbi:MAG TPA: phasin family protein [Stellaceae bacterium]
MDTTTKRAITARGNSNQTPAPQEPALAAASPQVPVAVAPASADPSDFSDDVLAAMTESQTALVRGLEAANREISALARLGIDIAARNATGLTAARTWPDAVAVGSESTRAGLDALAEGALKFSEIGLRLVLDLAKPISKRLIRV